MSSSTTRWPSQVNRFIEMTRKAQMHYNQGFVEMMKNNYEESQRELDKCIRLRLFMFGPFDFQVAIVHEAIGDLKLRMSSNNHILQIQSSSGELKQAATTHYLSALRIAEHEQLDRIQQEEAMNLIIKKQEGEKYSDLEIDDDSTSSIQPKNQSTKYEEIEFMIKRILISLRRLDTLPY